MSDGKVQLISFMARALSTDGVGVIPWEGPLCEPVERFKTRCAVGGGVDRADHRRRSGEFHIVTFSTGSKVVIDPTPSSNRTPVEWNRIGRPAGQRKPIPLSGIGHDPGSCAPLTNRTFTTVLEPDLYKCV